MATQARLAWLAILAVAIVTVGGGVEGAGPPVATSFTYQGTITYRASPLNGLCDLRFGLFNALTGGRQVGPSRTLQRVKVSKGVFTVELDFGSIAFSGERRWLEIAVRQGSSPYTTLQPRQAVTAAPYVLYALKARSVDRAAKATSADRATRADRADYADRAGKATTADSAARVDGAPAPTAAATGGGIPSGFSILGSTEAPPPGFTYTSQRVLTEPSGNIWQAMADLPGDTHANLAAVAVNGKVYVFGSEAHHEYDPGANTWTVKAAMPTPRTRCAAAAVNGKIYVIGGVGGDFANEEFDPATNRWTARASLPTARVDAAAAVVDGKIYVMGGQETTAGAKVLKAVEVYDPSDDTWTRLADMPIARHSFAAVAANGKIYTIGGYADVTDIVGPLAMYRPDRLLSTTEEYDPATDNWLPMAAMPSARTVLAAAEADGKIYAIGGLGAGQMELSATGRFDPAEDTWVAMADLPTSRCCHGAAAVDGKIYVFGGAPDGLPTTMQYTPVGPRVYLYVHRKD